MGLFGCLIYSLLIAATAASADTATPVPRIGNCPVFTPTTSGTGVWIAFRPYAARRR
ncbi:MAG: hypothetical protein M3Q39_12080 [Actinomycetota bacterium]|nr:hypothetical protein [Actinomycetota bacterium]